MLGIPDPSTLDVKTPVPATAFFNTFVSTTNRQGQQDVWKVEMGNRRQA